jgi:alkylated DNA repair dioxygenase AlkB
MMPHTELAEKATMAVPSLNVVQVARVSTIAEVSKLAESVALLVFTDMSIVETDFRYDKLVGFLPKLRQKVGCDYAFISINITEPAVSVEDHKRKLQSNEEKNLFHDTYYIASFCRDYKALYQSHLKRMMNTLSEFVLVQETSSDRKMQRNINIVYLEDLLWVERPYISSHQTNSFWTTLRNSGQLFKNSLHVKIVSTNVLVNSFGEGDCSVVYLEKLFEAESESETAKRKFWVELQEQIEFKEMFNRGSPVPRLVSIQSIRNTQGNRPLYRHPNDEEPTNCDMVPMVRDILRTVELGTGIKSGDINHVLIQCYRDGSDNIQQHSDKTLDINLDTPILNVSFGVSRNMFIQRKTDKLNIERIPLNHGECVIFGLKTNQHWLHEVPKDVGMLPHHIYDKTRISFTFRRIDTYVDEMSGRVYGQGSRYKTVEEVRTSSVFDLEHEVKKLTNEDAATAPSAAATTDDSILTSATAGAAVDSTHGRKALINAFHYENKQSDLFNWQDVYGGGFEMK